VDHRRRFLDVPAKGAKLDITVEARDRDHTDRIMAALDSAGYRPIKLPAGTAID
jgi:threonine dehydratase